MTKQDWLVISFQGTHEAMLAEKLFQEAGIEGRLIPTPRCISASCGLCYRTQLGLREKVEQVARDLRVENYYTIQM